MPYSLLSAFSRTAQVFSRTRSALASSGAIVRALLHYNADARIGNLRFIPRDLFATVELVHGDLHDAELVTRLVDGSRRLSHITEVMRMESDVITLQDVFVAKPPDEDSAAPGATRLLTPLYDLALTPRSRRMRYVRDRFPSARLRGRTFDVIYGSSSIEHWHEDLDDREESIAAYQRDIRECYELLRPGGVLLITRRGAARSCAGAGEKFHWVSASARAAGR